LRKTFARAILGPRLSLVARIGNLGCGPGNGHIDVCELRLTDGKLFMFLAIGQVSKFTHIAFLDADAKINGVGSTGRGNSLCEGGGWRFVAKGFPRPGVEFKRDGIEFVLGMDGQIGPLGKVLA
jgi:hypothetical protein